MSTLSIPTPRTSSSSDVDARFEALVGSSVPTRRDVRRGAHPGVDFETVFDLGYGQPARGPDRVVATTRARRVRGLAKPREGAHRALRLTRRGRVVLVLVLLGVALAVTTALGGWAAAGPTGGTPEPVRVIEVAPGDTLYGIAADLAQPGEIRAMVHRIQELNSLPGAQIAEGQKLAVPRG